MAKAAKKPDRKKAAPKRGKDNADKAAPKPAKARTATAKAKVKTAAKKRALAIPPGTLSEPMPLPSPGASDAAVLDRLWACGPSRSGPSCGGARVSAASPRRPRAASRRRSRSG